jgi:hypothetical protein
MKSFKELLVEQNIIEAQIIHMSVKVDGTPANNILLFRNTVTNQAWFEGNDLKDYVTKVGTTADKVLTTYKRFFMIEGTNDKNKEIHFKVRDGGPLYFVRLTKDSYKSAKKFLKGK